MTDEFQEFAKIPRLSRECVVTEKIDGTNAQVHVTDDGRVLAASRSRYIGLNDDNHGFARWVIEHEAELVKLGPGRHYGEWWGAGIQRRYGLAEKRFSLFNVTRWGDADEAEKRPACCHVVPVLYRGVFDTGVIGECLNAILAEGSRAAPGFMRPEGVVVWHEAARTLFKKTIEKDDEWKGRR